MKIAFKNLDKISAFIELNKNNRAVDLRTVLAPERIARCSIEAGPGLTYNYAAKAVNPGIISLLQELADEQQLLDKYRALLDGVIMNTGEKRMVLHHLTRGQLGADVMDGKRNLRSFYVDQQDRVNEFADRVHSGELRGSTGKAFDTVVQIGIGGSSLGPRALYLAMHDYARDVCGGLKMRADFISNVDPADANRVLGDVDLESTLFILVSKSGTTQETLTNQSLVREWMKESGIVGLEPGKHFIAVTGENSPLADPDEYLESFYIDHYIGGRYSSTSVVGGALLTLCFGKEIFAGILEGAHEADRMALEEDACGNAALLDALIGIFERNIVGYPVTCILPYSQALSRFPDHLQQLDMESNGKSVNRFGEPLDYSTGPVVFGKPGTNGQHSFYQLLHQGTDPLPLQFIGFENAQVAFDRRIDGSTSQTKLDANLAAQIVALAKGRFSEDPGKSFDGRRPSSLLHAVQLTPGVLGALLAHYENKIMFQGFAWNINSFDQEGVQLGKTLAKDVLSDGEVSPDLGSYAGILGVAHID